VLSGFQFVFDSKWQEQRNGKNASQNQYWMPGWSGEAIVMVRVVKRINILMILIVKY